MKERQPIPTGFSLDSAREPYPTVRIFRLRSNICPPQIIGRIAFVADSLRRNSFQTVLVMKTAEDRS
jgi:hypothetical protein